MSHEDDIASPEKQSLFDPKKLGRLAMARRALSMETEMTRSSRWNLPPQPTLPRSVSLEGHESGNRMSESVNLRSLRKLGGGEVVKGIPCRTLTGDDHSDGGGVDIMAQALTHGDRGGSHDDNIMRPPRAPKLQRPLSSADQKALLALAELGRRHRHEPPSIVLKSKNSFLVGDHPRKEVEGAVWCTPKDTKSQAQPTLHKHEPPNITFLSRLLFRDSPSTSEQSTPEPMAPACPLSQSDTDSSADKNLPVANNYLLQLGHIMGEGSRASITSLEERRDTAALVQRGTIAESTASTVSSLDHPESPIIDQRSTKRQSRFKQVLVLATFITLIIANLNTFVFPRVWGQLESTLLPIAERHYDALYHWVEEYVQEVKYVERQRIWNHWLEWKRRASDFSWRRTLKATDAPSHITYRRKLVYRMLPGHMNWMQVPGIVDNTSNESPTGISEARNHVGFSDSIAMQCKSEWEMPSRSQHNSSSLERLQSLVRSDLMDSIRKGSAHHSGLSCDAGNATQPANHSIARQVPRSHDSLDTFESASIDESHVYSVMMQSRFWKATRACAPFVSLELRDVHKVSETNVDVSCFLEGLIPDQCQQSLGNRNFCCASESPATHVIVPTLEQTLETLRKAGDDDGFLQVPLVDLVGEFFRDRKRPSKSRRQS